MKKIKDNYEKHWIMINSPKEIWKQLRELMASERITSMSFAITKIFEKAVKRKTKIL